MRGVDRSPTRKPWELALDSAKPPPFALPRLRVADLVRSSPTSLKHREVNEPCYSDSLPGFVGTVNPFSSTSRGSATAGSHDKRLGKLPTRVNRTLNHKPSTKSIVKPNSLRLTNSSPSFFKGADSLKLNSNSIQTIFRISDSEVDLVLNEAVKNKPSALCGDPDGCIIEARLTGRIHLAGIFERIAQEITRRMGSVLIDIGYLPNLNREFLDRDALVPQWHHHVPPFDNDPHFMFLMTICKDPSLATCYSLSQNFIKIRSLEGTKPKDPSSTSNIPLNSLVYFPVTRVHRTPILSAGVRDFRRIHLVIQIYTNPLKIRISYIHQNEQKKFREMLIIIQDSSGLTPLLAENILHYAGEV